MSVPRLSPHLLLFSVLSLLVTAGAAHAQGPRTPDGRLIVRSDPRSAENARGGSTAGKDAGGTSPSRQSHKEKMVRSLLDTGAQARTATPARYEQAVAAYNEALKLDPKEVRAYEGLGLTYAAEKKFEDAAKAFEQAVKIKPDRAEVHYNLGLLYHRLGRLEDVRAKSRTLRELKKKELAAKLEALVAS